MPTLRTRSTSRALNTCAALVAVLVGCGQEAPPPELPPRAIQWERVSGSLASQRRVISGIVTAIDETILAFEVAGTVHTVEVDLGAEVKKDQVLARLDPEPFQLGVRNAQAALAEARALREEARSTLARYQEAAASGAISQQQLGRGVAMADARASQVDAAQASLDLARRDLRLSVLEAPFHGVIASREADPAMRVAGGQIIFTLDSEEGGLRVEVQMPESLIARVRQGDEVEVGFPSTRDRASDVGDKRYPAIVSEVGGRAGVGNAFPVRADLLDPPPGLRPGMTAEVTFRLSRGESGLTALEGFMIPIAAALPEANNRFSVFVYDRDNSTVQKRPIRTGGVGDNTVAVLEGLEEGDIIATAGVSFLRDGQQVTLLAESLMRRTP